MHLWLWTILIFTIAVQILNFLDRQSRLKRKIEKYLWKKLQKQKEEMIAQQKYREEQRKGANFEKWLLIFNTAIAALLVSIFK